MNAKHGTPSKIALNMLLPPCSPKLLPFNMSFFMLLFLLKLLAMTKVLLVEMLFCSKFK